MIYEYPEYYTRFSCVGEECKDSCCIGWEIDIDEATYEYYKSVEGTFGKKLKEYMTGDVEKSFVLCDNNRCPFLNEKNLCDIYTELGEESLCKICTEYPRYYETIGDYQQIDMSLSCMEVGRFFTEKNQHINFLKRKDKATFETLEKEEKIQLGYLLLIRDTAIELIKKEEFDWYEKAFYLLQFITKVQKNWNDKDFKAIKKNCQKHEIKKNISKWNMGFIAAGNHTEKTIELATNMFNIMKALEVIDSDWIAEFKKAEKVIKADELKEYFLDFDEAIVKVQNVWYDNLLIYFLFRYFLRAFYDNNILVKAKFTIASVISIYVLDVVRWLEKGRIFDISDRIDISHLFSKEIEHSEENVDCLMEELMFMDILL